jgi:hypothetical protein
MDWHVCKVPSLAVQAIYVLRDQPFISQPFLSFRYSGGFGDIYRGFVFEGHTLQGAQNKLTFFCSAQLVGFYAAVDILGAELGLLLVLWFEHAICSVVL